MINFLRTICVASMLVSVTLLSACAFGTRQPTLVYPPESSSGVVPAAHAAIRPDSKNVQVFLSAFADKRDDKKVVGTVRNAFGMKTADVIPTNSVSEWVTEAVRMELQNNGYTVVSDVLPVTLTGKQTVVSGEILNVYCDMYFSYTGKVSLITRVNMGETEVLSKNYNGEGSAGMAVAMTAESYAESLALALSDALKHFISDLDEELGQQ